MSRYTDYNLKCLVPTPKSLKKAEGDLKLAPYICAEHEGFSVYTKTFCDTVAKICRKDVFSIGEGGVILRLNAALKKSSYVLDTLGDQAILEASDSEGILYAIATLTSILAFEEGLEV